MGNRSSSIPMDSLSAARSRQKFKEQQREEQQFGGSSTFEKMSRGVSGMVNSFKSKNQIAAENLIKKEYKSVGMGDDARKLKVLNLVRQRMDALDANNVNKATSLLIDIESALTKDGYGNSLGIPLPTKQWWKTEKSSFGRRKRRSNVKRSEFGRKRRSSKKRSSFGRKRRSSKKRSEFGRKRRSSKRRHC
jgi:hypothetical protein